MLIQFSSFVLSLLGSEDREILREFSFHFGLQTLQTDSRSSYLFPFIIACDNLQLACSTRLQQRVILFRGAKIETIHAPILHRLQKT